MEKRRHKLIKWIAWLEERAKPSVRTNCSQNADGERVYAALHDLLSLCIVGGSSFPTHLIRFGFLAEMAPGASIGPDDASLSAVKFASLAAVKHHAYDRIGFRVRHLPRISLLWV
jgi:hypothetical protein